MSSPQHEPTMEEILASIRKIISEDNPEPAAAAPQEPPPAEPPKPEAPKPEAPTPEANPESPPKPELEVLELTQEVGEQPSKPQAEAAPEVQAPPVPEPAPPAAEPEQTKGEEIVFEPIGARAPANDGIFSDHTRKALEETIAAIPDEPEESPREVPVSEPGGNSVESVFERAVKESFVPVLEQYLADNTGQVIERLTPLIRQWMDENFPPLLENAVKSEVERIVKARTRR